MKATATFVSGLHFKSETESMQTIEFDTSAEHGGDGVSSSPVDHLLASLCACSGMDVISILRKQKHEVTHFVIKADASRREIHPKIFTSVGLTYSFQGQSVPIQDIERAIELSLTKYCTIAGTLAASGCTIESSIEYTERTPET